MDDKQKAELKKKMGEAFSKVFVNFDGTPLPTKSKQCGACLKRIPEKEFQLCDGYCFECLDKTGPYKH